MTGTEVLAGAQPEITAHLCASPLRQLGDHFHRLGKSFAGFRVFGFSWLKPWLCYAISPLLNRVCAGRTARFGKFNVRLGECDLYTFANLFEDYPVREIERALSEVELVVDLGSNVGAFSCLVRNLCRKHRLDLPLVAVEPNLANIEFLRGQPFASELLLRHAAVGPQDGVARLVRGHNSVSDHVDFSGQADGREIPVVALKSLCDRPALVKMDIEGGEWPILEGGLPETVRHLVLEWHPPDDARRSLLPNDFVPGDWKLISRDMHGLSMWYFSRA